MKVTADTNILVRAIVEDDERQAKLAQTELANAEMVALPLVALCELAWVLSDSYGVSRARIATAIRQLTIGGNIAVNLAAVDAGLAMLDAGGDFADGVIAYEGFHQGGDVFLSFDRKAVKLAQAQGHAARLLA